MNENIAQRMAKTFDESQTKNFIKLIKDNKYECYFKLIMTYNLSVMELVNLEWSDVDFENNLITIYKITRKPNGKFYYSWDMKKNEDFMRTYPLPNNLKRLLFELKEKQEENDNFDNNNFICLKSNGTRLNINTLSRNLRYIARDNGLPEILLAGLKRSLENFICKFARDYDYSNAWLRTDYNATIPRNTYDGFNLNKNKRFVKDLNNLLEQDEQFKFRKSEMEM